MKKLISVVLAFCMLFSVVAAANTITQNGDAVLDDAERTVTVAFVGIPEAEQATLFAYEVTDAMITEATPIPAFVDNTTTPIKGIDQATVSTITTTVEETRVSSFTFKVAAEYVGKMVVKVGGTDAEPIAMLVEFEAAETPNPVEPLIIYYGDSDGDDKLETSDANAILAYLRQRSDAKRLEINTNYGTKLGTSYETEAGVKVLFGDSDGDGKLETSDANAILAYLRQRSDAKRLEINTNYGTKLGSSVEVLVPASNN